MIEGDEDRGTNMYTLPRHVSLRRRPYGPCLAQLLTYLHISLIELQGEGPAIEMSEQVSPKNDTSQQNVAETKELPSPSLKQRHQE